MPYTDKEADRMTKDVWKEAFEAGFAMGMELINQIPAEEVQDFLKELPLKGKKK
jgi:hypothetical protein